MHLLCFASQPVSEIDLFCACWRCAVLCVSHVAGFRNVAFPWHCDAKEVSGIGRDGRLNSVHSNHRHLPKAVLVESFKKILSFSKKEGLSSSSPQKCVVKSLHQNNSGQKTFRKPLCWLTVQEVSDV